MQRRGKEKKKTEADKKQPKPMRERSLHEREEEQNKGGDKIRQQERRERMTRKISLGLVLLK